MKSENKVTPVARVKAAIIYTWRLIKKFHVKLIQRVEESPKVAVCFLEAAMLLVIASTSPYSW